MSKATDKWFRILKGIPLNEQASAEQLVQTFKAAYKNKTGDDYKDEKWLQQYAEKNPKGLAGEIERMGGAVGKPAADKEKLKKLMARGQRCNRAGFKGFGHEDVGDVKAALGKADYKVSEGNKYGIETLKAVIAFQKEKGLKVDGCVGPKKSRAQKLPAKRVNVAIKNVETPGALVNLCNLLVLIIPKASAAASKLIPAGRNKTSQEQNYTPARQ